MQTSEPCEPDEFVAFAVGAVLAVEDGGVSLYPVGMTLDEAITLLRGYIKAAEQTKGMTRQ